MRNVANPAFGDEMQVLGKTDRVLCAYDLILLALLYVKLPLWSSWPALHAIMPFLVIALEQAVIKKLVLQAQARSLVTGMSLL